MWKETVRRVELAPKPFRPPLTRWGALFLGLALLSSLAAFEVLPTPAPGLAKICFAIFLICFFADVANALLGRRRRPSS
jgi:uncharacterized membrane protein YtjA (UPF0391 family)